MAAMRNHCPECGEGPAWSKYHWSHGATTGECDNCGALRQEPPAPTVGDS